MAYYRFTASLIESIGGTCVQVDTKTLELQGLNPQRVVKLLIDL
jgi:hypothetical protein